MIYFQNKKKMMTGTTVEVEGYPLILEKSKGKPLKNYKIYGNSVQKVTNIFDGTYKGGYIASNKITAFRDTPTTHYLAVIPCSPNTTYVVEKEYATERFVVGFTDEYPYTGLAVTNSVTGYTAQKIISTSGATSQYLVAFVYNTNLDTLPLPNLKVYEAQSPDNPIEVESVGDLVTDTSDENYGKYKIPIKVSGNNLFDINSVELTQNCEIVDNGIQFTGSGSFDILLPAGKYTISFDNNGVGTCYIRNGKVGSGYITILNKTDTKKTFNYTADYDGYLRISAFSSGQMLSNIQIEEGTEATDYEVYVEPLTTNIYLDEPLRKIGDYADYIDFANKKAVRTIVNYTITGQESWRLANTGADHISCYLGIYDITGYATTGNTNRLNIVSDKLITANLTNVECIKCSGVANSKTSGLINVTLSKSRIGYENTDTEAQAVEKFKNWLANNNINVNYVINEFSELIEEEIELPSILLNKGTNIIEVDTKINPGNMYAKYIRR